MFRFHMLQINTAMLIKSLTIKYSKCWSLSIVPLLLSLPMFNTTTPPKIVGSAPCQSNGFLWRAILSNIWKLNTVTHTLFVWAYLHTDVDLWPESIKLIIIFYWFFFLSASGFASCTSDWGELGVERSEEQTSLGVRQWTQSVLSRLPAEMLLGLYSTVNPLGCSWTCN